MAAVAAPAAEYHVGKQGDVFVPGNEMPAVGTERSRAGDGEVPGNTVDKHVGERAYD